MSQFLYAITKQEFSHALVTFASDVIRYRDNLPNELELIPPDADKLPDADQSMPNLGPFLYRDELDRIWIGFARGEIPKENENYYPDGFGLRID